MPFYPPEARRGQFPAPRQRFGPPTQNSFNRRNEANYYGNQFDPRQGQQMFNQFDPRQGQQMFNPYQQQPQPSRFGMVSDNLNTMMGHMGTVTNGINMMRQVGGLMSLFRL